jgi:hypothetical protein
MITRGIVIGTGPSLALQIPDIHRLKGRGYLLFGVNNTFRDFDLDHWIACDPAWHRHYGRVSGPFKKWHWDEGICNQYGYTHIQGRWFDGVSPPGSDWISFNHGSGPQALNLAVLHCDEVLLVGHDMTYRDDEPRHYFSGLSDKQGEYPPSLRKFSPFEKPRREGGAHPDGDGILYNYKHIAEQAARGDIPPIYNCTPRSAMKWFPFRDLGGYA